MTPLVGEPCAVGGGLSSGHRDCRRRHQRAAAAIQQLVCPRTLKPYPRTRGREHIGPQDGGHDDRDRNGDFNVAHWRQTLQIDDRGQQRNKKDHGLWVAQRQ